jgi:hypothetical protein
LLPLVLWASGARVSTATSCWGLREFITQDAPACRFHVLWRTGNTRLHQPTTAEEAWHSSSFWVSCQAASSAPLPISKDTSITHARWGVSRRHRPDMRTDRAWCSAHLYFSESDVQCARPSKLSDSNDIHSYHLLKALYTRLPEVAYKVSGLPLWAKSSMKGSSLVFSLSFSFGLSLSLPQNGN